MKTQSGDVGRICAVAAFMQEKAQSPQFPQALKSLRNSEAMLDKAERAGPGPRATGNTSDSGPSLVKLQRARLTWQTTRAMVGQQLRTLEAETLKSFEGRAEMPIAVKAVRRLVEMLKELGEDLIDALDDALNEPDPDLRRELQKEARACIKNYESFVLGNDPVAAIDVNSFIKISLKA